VQDLIIKVQTTEYRLERWQTPDGKYVAAPIPAEVGGTHFGPELKRYILFQHHSNRVPQNKIHEQLLEMGISISRGEIDKILSDAVAQFRQEKEDILDVGLRTAQCIQTDDTGARHAGQNGFCVVIRNDLFSCFVSTQSKSRINFLRVLQGKNPDYVINDVAIEYCIDHEFKEKLLDHVRNNKKVFKNDEEWQMFLTSYAMTNTQQKALTEAALLGSLVHHGVPKDLTLVSDDAGQYNLFIHALCWAHALRNIQKVVAADEQTYAEVETVMQSMQQYYTELKNFTAHSSAEDKVHLQLKFDSIIATKVVNPALKKALAKLMYNKDELLRVLDYPFIPLTNNGSERDIRTYVIKRKISGGTRSSIGREGRDVFTSLCSTCRKLRISFWEYLGDRIRKIGHISYLPVVIKTKSQMGAAP
jgi:hypothetical protein